MNKVTLRPLLFFSNHLIAGMCLIRLRSYEDDAALLASLERSIAARAALQAREDAPAEP